MRAFAVSPIFFSQSSDHGETWTLPIEISGRNFDICPTFECYDDQGSDLVVGRDGSLYAAFANRDSPTLAEQLLFSNHAIARLGRGQALGRLRRHGRSCDRGRDPKHGAKSCGFEHGH